MKSEHMHISITKEQKEMLRELAEADNRSMNSYIGQLIEKDYRNRQQYERHMQMERGE